MEAIRVNSSDFFVFIIELLICFEDFDIRTSKLRNFGIIFEDRSFEFLMLQFSKHRRIKSYTIFNLIVNSNEYVFIKNIQIYLRIYVYYEYIFSFSSIHTNIFSEASNFQVRLLLKITTLLELLEILIEVLMKVHLNFFLKFL